MMNARRVWVLFACHIGGIEDMRAYAQRAIAEDFAYLKGRKLVEDRGEFGNCTTELGAAKVQAIVTLLDN